mmetsp:Transcript_21586/g.44295  ORF Transcript_21586/g.44295 Transcript_21586/m.44295 type:complete len:120 (+) Transcript_21586:529-888(+)
MPQHKAQSAKGALKKSAAPCRINFFSERFFSGKLLFDFDSAPEFFFEFNKGLVCPAPHPELVARMGLLGELVESEVLTRFSQKNNKRSVEGDSRASFVGASLAHIYRRVRTEIEGGGAE